MPRVPPSLKDVDWHDRFFELERKYLELKKATNGKENAERLQRVAAERQKRQQRQGAKSLARPATAAADGRTRGASGAVQRLVRPAALQPDAIARQQQQQQQQSFTSVTNTSTSSAPVRRAGRSGGAARRPTTTTGAFRSSAAASAASSRSASSGTSVTSRSTSPLKRATLRETASSPHRTASPYRAAAAATAAAATQHSPHRRGPGDIHYVGAAQHQHQQQQQQQQGKEGDTAPPPPDPLMVWGVESHLVQHVQANALLDMNHRLRAKVEEADEAIRQLQHDVAVARSGNAQLHANLDEARAEVHQLVRERDVAVQKMENALHHVGVLQQQQAAARGEQDQMRFQLEAQLRELRAKLSVGNDNNDSLARDLRTLLHEVKEKTSVAAALESKLRLAEVNLSASRNTNETMLREMEGLTAQLANERKRLLAATRENHVSALTRQQLNDVERELQQVRGEKAAFEAEHVRLLESMVQVSATAQAKAVEHVSARMQELEEAAAHWERVAQLQFKDVSEKVAAHRLCREECNEAKRARDEAEAAAKALRAELLLANAKLDVVWPNHRLDTKGIPAEKVAAAFDKVKIAMDGTHRRMHRYRRATADELGLEIAGEVSLEEQLLELEELNAALVADLNQQRVANELLTTQLREAQRGDSTKCAELQERLGSADRDARTSEGVIERQSRRIHFLEEQVRAIKGREVDRGISLESIGDNDTVFEVFVGQLQPRDEGLRLLQLEPGVSVGAAPSSSSWSPPVLFLVVEFLLHEPVLTATRVGSSCFFDATFAYQIAMDPLLVHYLHTRTMLVQLCRVTGAAEAHAVGSNARSRRDEYEIVAEGGVDLADLLAPPCVDSSRPSIAGCLTLRTVAPEDGGAAAPARDVALLEFSVTSRMPLSAEVRAHAARVRASPPRLAPSSAHGHAADGSPLPAAGTAAAAASAATNTSAASSAGANTSAVALLREPSNVLAVERVHSFGVALREIRVDFDQPHLPLLSAYYVLEALGSECDAWWMPPTNARPRHEVECDPSTATATFPVPSAQAALRLAADGVALFFFDELTERFEQVESYWGVALVPLRTELLEMAGELAPCTGAGGADEVRRRTLRATIRTLRGDRCGEVVVDMFVGTAVITAPQRPAQPEGAAAHRPPESADERAQQAEAESRITVVASAAARPAQPLSTKASAAPSALAAPPKPWQRRKAPGSRGSGGGSGGVEDVPIIVAAPPPRRPGPPPPAAPLASTPPPSPLAAARAASPGTDAGGGAGGGGAAAASLDLEMMRHELGDAA